jgi:hypothetical protein
MFLLTTEHQARARPRDLIYKYGKNVFNHHETDPEKLAVAQPIECPFTHTHAPHTSHM